MQIGIGVIIGFFISALSIAIALLMAEIFTGNVSTLLVAIFSGMSVFGLLIGFDAIVSGRKKKEEDDD